MNDSSTVPSPSLPRRQSWFARHCAPPPPINAAGACPCTGCYGGETARSYTASSFLFSSSGKLSRKVYQTPGGGDSVTALLAPESEAADEQQKDGA
jgi:hypothetical protein